ncbi:MAG: 7,8-didemethyl-8-hydroxy-5-deazariboflavin synthase subunit CofH [Acidobacteria bacterium]|nr:7,8-didemethyl-8-hydroxy-5-deazariboflavin synthase subunit CofH [Acidobacteriota bacterium]MYJ05710.1 7,8-didemethyl-8-hydroxy-5-deazariboflavin synthase subunit CofH [Acidobacteriota bacterium]
MDARAYARPSRESAADLARTTDLRALMQRAASLRDAGFGRPVSYSRKVFIPLTKLCRDVCHYCTFAQPPRPGERAYLTLDEAVDIARSGAAAGCREALFTLGDKPELRYPQARAELAALGYPTTVAYLVAAARAVFEATGLLPHANPGVMTRSELLALREVCPSQGLMLESVSRRLLEPGAAHHGSPDKDPGARLETIRLAGELAIPFTSGILIGIGETRQERVDSLLALRDLHDAHGHLQEIIVQNFRAKPGTRMVDASEPTLEDLQWTIACARILFGPEMAIQAPPNLTPETFRELIRAGINDWGGVSPVTPDHVNPEAPWPHLDRLACETAREGKVLTERLTVYPAYVRRLDTWVAEPLRTAVLQASDAEGFARDSRWAPGDPEAVLPTGLLDELSERPATATPITESATASICAKAARGDRLDETEITHLFTARGDDLTTVVRAADTLRREVNGETVTYVVNRNINYTNVCYFRCRFCAFSKGKLSENLRGAPYDLDLDEIARRTREAWERGATEVCMQGGIHPDYTGATYLAICRTVKEAVPAIHVHAFSPLEVWQGAATLGLPLKAFLQQLRDAGLGTLPGTAAEVLHDEVRQELCPDKLNSEQWLEVMETAHRVGFRTTATIMYGHIDHPHHWARHLAAVRDLQTRTGGFTEFVPLPFVHMEAPIYLQGRARRGPTFRESLLMHAVARLALHPVITNIQASWVKMGPRGVHALLNAGVNDLGGTLMNESITRAAGAGFGQELPPERMEALIIEADRTPRQRTTTYGVPPAEQTDRSYHAEGLSPVIQTPAPAWAHRGPREALVRPGLGTDMGETVVDHAG